MSVHARSVAHTSGDIRRSPGAVPCEPTELPAELTGDRHCTGSAAVGRLVVVTRDSAARADLGGVGALSPRRAGTLSAESAERCRSPLPFRIESRGTQPFLGCENT